MQNIFAMSNETPMILLLANANEDNVGVPFDLNLKLSTNEKQFHFILTFINKLILKK